MINFIERKKDKQTIMSSSESPQESNFDDENNPADGTILVELEDSPKFSRRVVNFLRRQKRYLLITFLWISLLTIILIVIYAINSHTTDQGKEDKLFDINETQKLTVEKCRNGEGLEKTKPYLAVVTMVLDKRRYIREWIEFHRLMGFTHFLVYDNNSVDKLENLLQPYIDACIVTYILWPPVNNITVDIHDEDKLVERERESLLKLCRFNNETIHAQSKCQEAAFNDAVLRSRDHIRWLGCFDVDEYFYLPESMVPNPIPTPPNLLIPSFKELELFDVIEITGPAFGTAGWLSSPMREDNVDYASLVTSTHIYRASYDLNLDPTGYRHKSIYNPSRVTKASIHNVFGQDLKKKWMLMHNMSHELGDIYFNHYRFYSMTEATLKSEQNKNPNANFSYSVDALHHEYIDTKILYFNSLLKEAIEKSLQIYPSTDGHADDWDFTLEHKHIFNSTKNTDICVRISNVTRIDLVRHSLQAVINYFYNVEPNLNYHLSVYNVSTEVLMSELRNDFPIDSFDDMNNCTSQFIMDISENSFARWELWPKSFQVVQMSIYLLNSTPVINKVYLGDVMNEADHWNWQVLKKKGSKEQILYYNDENKLHSVNQYITNTVNHGGTQVVQLCFQDNNCINKRVQGLFENTNQSRILYRQTTLGSHNDPLWGLTEV